MEPLYVIVNPAAAGGRARRLWPGYRQVLVEMGVEFNTQFTDGPGDATRLARKAVSQNYRGLLIAGGDGTVNEAVNGIFSKAGPVEPEALPKIVICGLGTGSDLVKSLTDVSGAEGFRKLIKQGKRIRIDLGEISYTTDHGQVTRYFVNIADAGLGGAVVSNLKQGFPRVNGLLTYLLAGMKSILTYDNRHMRLKLDGRPVIDGPLNSIMVANGRFFAGGMEIAPRAEVSDGVLDILVVRGMNKLKTAFCFYRAYSGRHLSHKGVEYFRGKEVVIDSPERVLLDIDGETGGRLPARIRVYPRKLPVIV